MSLAHRSITSAAWNSVANLTRLVMLIVRSILLARLLPVETFGVYAFANSVMVLTVVVPNFGMDSAFIHRAPETADMEQAASVHFTLKLIFTLIWAVLLVAGTLVFATGETRTALLLLTATTTGMQLAQTPRLILSRRVMHRRLAIIGSLSTLLTTVVALGLAWQGQTLWALLFTDIVTLVLTILGLYVWRPVWRPHLSWSGPLVRYFLRFGSRSLLADGLLRALDRVDDLWTGLFLGNVQLGYYSKAYTFATYPRLILSEPVSSVAAGTYAELKEDRRRLSQAFFRTNALLIRSGFFLGGMLALVAPEFIRLVLGEKWLPMLDAFRLMLVFTLLDPIKATVAHLFIAAGKPAEIVQARTVQLAVLAIGLFALGRQWGIVGVALAVDAMLVIGMVILLWKARSHVDYSNRRLFFAPAVALIFGLALAVGLGSLNIVTGSDLRTGSIKAVSFVVVYAVILLALERQETIELFQSLTRRIRSGE